MLLKDNHVFLRSLEHEDARTLWNLAKSSNAGSRTTPYWYPWTVNDFEEYIANGNSKDTSRIQLGICIFTNGSADLIGTVELHKLNWIHGSAEVGIIIWDESVYRNGTGSATLKLVCGWAFRALRLRRLYAKVFANNVAALRCLTKMGFRKEGQMRQHFFIDGQPVDGILLGLLADEWLD
jgi:RimJ/RimL family protein N-acetyltransferase